MIMLGAHRDCLLLSVMLGRLIVLPPPHRSVNPPQHPKPSPSSEVAYLRCGELHIFTALTGKNNDFFKIKSTKSPFKKPLAGVGGG